MPQKSNTNNLEAIEEAAEETIEVNMQQVVPVTYEGQKLARNALLKQKAKNFAGIEEPAGKPAEADHETFLTGTGLPGRKKKKQKEPLFMLTEDGDKFYNRLEDQLDDEVN